jgi:D-alanyl-D-alanine carboxypeptidase (penicillin-binding protein 5/6)
MRKKFSERVPSATTTSIAHEKARKALHFRVSRPIVPMFKTSLSPSHALMTILTRYCFVALFVLLLVCSAIPRAMAAAEFTTEAQQAILIDVKTNTILFEKNADEPGPPASMVKLMTLALLFNALEKGEVTLETEYTVSLHAWKTGGAPSRTTAMFAPLNSQVTVNDLLQGIIVQSANDACIIVAEGLAGSEPAFTDMMNEYARKIGLKNTTFRNATGLPDPGNKTTVRDLGLLAMHIIEKFPKYLPNFKQNFFKYRVHPFYNLNPIFKANISSDVSSVGFSADFGSGTVTSTEQDGRRLIVVLNGVKGKKWLQAEEEAQNGRRGSQEVDGNKFKSTSLQELKNNAIRLLSWGYRNFKKFTVFDAGEIVGEAMTWGGSKGYVKLRGANNIPVTILLPIQSQKRRFHGEIVYLGPVKPPVAIGDRIGELRVTTSDGISTSAPLEAAESVEKAGIIRQGTDSLIVLLFGWFIHHQGSYFNLK